MCDPESVIGDDGILIFTAIDVDYFSMPAWYLHEPNPVHQDVTVKHCEAFVISH